MATESASVAAPSDLATRVSASHAPRRLNALALALLMVAGSLCLALPFWGDQALFAVYGRELARGAVLYRDVFDVKQPGIFVFYAIAGSLFGFTEVGIHVFELLYWMVFSLFAVSALRAYFTTRWASSLVPVFTVVVYYCYAGLLDLTQVEILVAFPVLAAWWLIDGARLRDRRGVLRYAGAGLAAAAVVLFKHLYVLIVFGFLVYAVLRARRHGVSIREQRPLLIAFAVALVVPLLAVVAYFAAYGQLGRIWWAYFELAPSAQLGGPRPLGYLLAGARRFLIGHGPLLILGTFGLVDALRRGIRPKFDLAAAMALWISIGAVAFLIQGWPVYKWSLFTVPVGILGVLGVDSLVGVVRSRRSNVVWIVFGVCLVLAVPIVVVAASAHVQTLLISSVVIGCCAALAACFIRSRSVAVAMLVLFVAALAISVGLASVAPVNKVRVLARHDFALTVAGRADLRRSLNYSYLAADHDLAVVRRRGAALGSLYVFGDPVLLLRAKRSQAASILGWGPELLDTRGWRALYSELVSSLPRFIVVDDQDLSIIRSGYPAILDFIESRYEIAFVGKSGTWYRLLLS
jgi:hypothetical protein